MHNVKKLCMWERVIPSARYLNRFLLYQSMKVPLDGSKFKLLRIFKKLPLVQYGYRSKRYLPISEKAMNILVPFFRYTSM